MATRSFICVFEPEQGYRGIYCHYDGYPSHVGRLLVAYHNSLEAANKLIHGTQIRSLIEDTVGRYSSDQEDDSEVFDSIREALDSGYDYAYLFDNGQWKCYGPESGIYPKITKLYEIPA